MLVDAEPAVECDGLRCRERVHGPGHDPDVAEHLLGRHVDTCCAGRERCLGREEPPPINHEPLDVRRRHRLGAQEEPGQRFGVDKRHGRGVQRRDRPLGVCDVGGDVTVQAKAAACEQASHVRFVASPGV
jgi:hypothetical protein